MEIQLIPAYDHGPQVCELIQEYIAAQLMEQPNFRGYLTQQHYEEELLHPEQKYGMPEGRLYLLLCDGFPAGCIGLRKIDAESCEMKRLYIRPQYRRAGLGDLLVRQLLADAREIGYRRMLLDTFPFMEPALRLYKRHGFYEIPSYNGSPMKELVYLQKDIREAF